MFIARHPNGKYYIYYQKLDGKRTCKSTGSTIKKDATKFLLRFQKELEEKANQKFIPIGLKEFSFNFLRYSEPFYTDKTMEVYKTAFKFLQKHFGNIQLSELTTLRIEEYLHTRLKQSSVFAARHDLSCLSCALNKAVRDGYLLANPCRGIRRFKLPERLPMFYSKEDFSKLLSAIDEEEIKDITVFAVNTGLRQAELITMEWRQVDFDEKIVTLDNRTHLTKGKKIRSIPLNATALNMMLKRFASRPSSHDFVFTYKGEKIEQKFLSRYYKKFILAAGLNPKLNFHSLRHTFASYLVQKGVSIYTVSKLLGHADISTTQIYSHLRREDLRHATDQIDM